MAVIARNSDEVSTPASILFKRDHNPCAREPEWLVAKKDRDETSVSGTFQPSIFSDSFFYLSSSEARKNTFGIFANKINAKHGLNSIKCYEHRTGLCQRTVDAVGRTGSEACCKDADFSTAYCHREKRSYVSDNANDLPSKMEIRCTYHHCRDRSTELNTPNTRQQCKMRCGDANNVQSSFEKSRFQATSHRTSHLCSETSNSHLSKLRSTFSTLTCGCKRRDKATVLANTSNKLRLWNVSYFSIFLTFVLLLATTGSVDGRRQHHRRGSGPRYPRDSGFNRGAARSAFSSQKCEDITVPLCKDIGYNKTDMSLSLMNKFTQAEAKAELDLFNPLLKLNCSTEMKLFLCSIYTPVCMDEYRQFLPPCRFICERAKRGCLPFLQKYSIPWPEHMRCEQFPRYTTKRPMCMHFNLTKPREETGKKDVVTPSSTKARRRKQSTSTMPTTTRSSTKYTTASPMSSVAVSIQTNGSCMLECREPMVRIINRDHPLYNKVSTGNVLNCAIPCKSPYFTESEIATAERIIKWFSIVCFVITLVTVTTYLVDMDRFEYPQRPIIFMSICYLFVSVGFLIRIVAGHAAVGCDYNTGHVLYHSTGPALCVTVFLLTYFFSMASAIWWVILSMTWFLAAALKWGNEAIAKYFQVYHIVAWIFPSILTILVLVLSCVDGDSFSGICFVGNQDVQNLRGFVLFPFVICFAGGGLFLLVGFISLIRIRSRVRKDGKKTDKFERLIVRIGFFNVLYMLSAAILVACYFYEQENRSSWEVNHNCNADKNSNSLNRPSFPILMARHLMTLVIGITNGVWICSSKTLDSWKGFYRRCMCSLYNTSCSPPCDKNFDKINVRVDQNANEGISSNDKWSCHSSNRHPSLQIYHESLDNRHDSCHSRHSSAKQESDNLTRSKGSRNSSASRNTLSRQDTCVYCSQSQSARTSTNHSGSLEPARKRKKKRSRKPSESFLQASRRKRNDVEQGDEVCQMLCNSNTTSTDGSDRLTRDTESRGESVEPETIVPLKQTSHMYLASSRQPSITFEKSSLSNEHCDSGLNISDKYVINCDNLPPPIPRPCASGHSCVSSCAHSQCCDGDENCETRLCKNDHESDTVPPLHYEDSELLYHCKDDSQSYYQHFHQHHCQGKILS